MTHFPGSLCTTRQVVTGLLCACDVQRLLNLYYVTVLLIGEKRIANCKSFKNFHMFFPGKFGPMRSKQFA